jgi:hypothetical protein
MHQKYSIAPFFFSLILLLGIFVNGILSLNHAIPENHPASESYDPKVSSVRIDGVEGEASSDSSGLGLDSELSQKELAIAHSVEKLNSAVDIQKDKTGHYIVDGEGKFPNRRYRTQSSAPNDPLYDQWWLEGSGVSASWQTNSGQNQTLLAIIDTGFGLNHEEFQGRWHVNSEESGPTTEENPSILNCTDRGLPLDKSCNNIDDNRDGIINNESGPTTEENPSILNCTDRGLPLDKSCNLIDDSGNGLIDDVTGYDFLTFHPSSRSGKTNPSGSAVAHGTRVAGVAAATGNNGKGIAGVDWYTKILPLQAINDDGYGDTLSVARAIYYAVSQGADVINLSLGTPSEDSYVRSAIATAVEAGVIIVASSGNTSCDCVLYPAQYPEVIAVGALGSDNQPASFSSYGNSLDVLAPGAQIRTTNWSATNGTNSYVNGAAGTSYASPIVAALATRLIAHEPDATPAQVAAAIRESTNPMGMQANVARSSIYGYGRIRASTSIDRIKNGFSADTVYAFSDVEAGYDVGSFDETNNAAGGLVYGCPVGKRPGSPVYELSSGSSRVYTISLATAWALEQTGYGRSVAAYACVSMPNDAFTNIRLLQIGREFRQ